MERSEMFDLVNGVCEWISNLAYLNLLWIIFTVMGVGVMGIAPATAALFAVIRQLLQAEGGKVAITKSFFNYYRRDFFRVNGVFYALVAVGLVLVVDSFFLARIDGFLASVLLFPIYILGIMYLIIIVFIFPVFVHYEETWYNYLKQAFLIGMIRPLHALLIIVLSAVSFLLMYKYTPLFLFFGASVIAFISMSVCLKVFDGIHPLSRTSKDGDSD